MPGIDLIFVRCTFVCHVCCLQMQKKCISAINSVFPMFIVHVVIQQYICSFSFFIKEKTSVRTCIHINSHSSSFSSLLVQMAYVNHQRRVGRDEFVSEYSVPRIITQCQGLLLSTRDCPDFPAIFANIFVLNCLSLSLMMASAF